MIKVDISNIWGELSLPDLLSVETGLSAAHMAVSERSGAGSEYLGWLELPDRAPTAEHMRILAAAAQIRETSDILVVIGTEYPLGARAAIELLQGPHRNLRRSSGEVQILFAGNDLSTRSWNELTKLLEGRDFSLCVISRAGETLESAIALRSLKWMLERRCGTAQAKRRIYAVTDPKEGVLRRMADEEGWESFSLPADVTGPFSVLTPAGLLPMAVAGIDVMEMLRGAAQARRELDLRSFENPVWLYASVRYLMQRRNKAIELLGSFEPGFAALGRWWQQLFATGEGKNGQGLFPAWIMLTEDLYGLGQFVQSGRRNLFETILRFEPPKQRFSVVSDVKDVDGLNYLSNRSLSDIQELVCQGILSAHEDGGCPVVTIDCGPLDAASLGELFYFFELSCAVSAYMQGANPFDAGGAELWQQNAARLLGKPEQSC